MKENRLTPYNQAFRDGLQFLSKYVYLNKGTKSLQADITNLCHWLDENPVVNRKRLLAKCASILRKFVKYERY